MNEFKRYHPIVNFCYFAVVLCGTMVFMHPALLFISFVCAYICAFFSVGKRALKFNVLYMLPAFIAAFLIPPVFSHEGATILAYLPSGNPVTKESLLYSLAAAVMLITSVTWFTSLNSVMTSDKIIYLAGRLTPSLSLVFSMCLRYVPMFSKRLKKILLLRTKLKENEPDTVLNKMKNALCAFSAAVSLSLEESIDTSDSMKCRGYLQKGRTFYSNYRFTIRDGCALLWIFAFSLVTVIGKIFGKTDFSYYPYIKSNPPNVFSAIVFASYFLLCILPVIIEIKEEIKWRALRSKI